MISRAVRTLQCRLTPRTKALRGCTCGQIKSGLFVLRAWERGLYKDDVQLVLFVVDGKLRSGCRSESRFAI